MQNPARWQRVGGGGRPGGCRVGTGAGKPAGWLAARGNPKVNVPQGLAGGWRPVIPKVLQRTPDYPKVPQDTPGYLGLVCSTFSVVPWGTHGYLG